MALIASLKELTSSFRVLDFATRDPLLSLPSELYQLDFVHRSRAGRMCASLVAHLLLSTIFERVAIGTAA